MCRSGFPKLLWSAVFLLLSAQQLWAKDVTITSTPPGARVSVDGRVLVSTPLKTTKKEIMPTWARDGVVTSATILINLPLYEPKSVPVSEFRCPSQISVTLEKRRGVEHFENYLEERPELQDLTSASDNSLLRVSDDLDEDGAALFGQGYVLIGYAGYTAEVVPMDAVRERAEAMEAGIVLISSRLAGVQTELREVTTRTSGRLVTSLATGSSTTTGSGSFSGSVTGRGSPISISGGSSGWTSTTGVLNSFSFIPGQSRTEFVPFSKRQFETQVAFWRKRKPNPLGAYTELLPTPVRQALQRNTGAFVVAIEDDSPAFFANLLVGDVVVGLQEQAINRPKDLEDAVSRHPRGRIQLEILRAGKAVSLSVDLQAGN